MTRQREEIWSRLVIMITLLGSSPGCSLIFVKTAPASDGGIVSRSRPAECTSSRLAPAFDTGIGAFQLVRTGFAVGADDSVYDDPDQLLSRGADIAIGASLTALFVGSAIYGFVHTGRCAALRDSSEEVPDEAMEKWQGDSSRPQAPPPAKASAETSAQVPAPAATEPAPSPVNSEPAPTEPLQNEPVPSAPSP